MGLSGAERRAQWRVRQAAEVERMRKAAAALRATPASKRKIDALHRRVPDLEAELAQERAAKVAKPAPPRVDPDSEVARLREENRKLRAKLRQLQKSSNATGSPAGPCNAAAVLHSSMSAAAVF